MIAAIALDLGSTSVKAGLLDEHGHLNGIIALPAPAIYTEGGHCESDALAYAAIADQVLNSCLAQTDTLPSLGLCSQRSSFLLWEQASGQPLTPLISWQDTRGAASCVALQSQERRISELSGLRLTPYYFAPKLRILLQENPQWRDRLLRGELRVGTLDTYLIWRWTGGKQYITDASMAARTLLMDIRRQQWSPELCDLFGIPLEILPAIKSSTGLNVQINKGLTLRASLADQSAALLASVGGARDVALVNLGTGGFVIRFQEEEKISMDGNLRTLVYQDNAHPAYMAIEGTLNSIAAALAPYPVAACKVEQLATHADIFCVAEPSGLGAPYFRQDIGLQFSTSVEHLPPGEIACLLLEAIIFRVVRIMEDFQRAEPVTKVYLSGGLSELSCLQQGIAQCLHCEVLLLQQHDASLQGAAMLAAGLREVSQQRSIKISIDNQNNILVAKYLRWKNWLDALLTD